MRMCLTKETLRSYSIDTSTAGLCLAQVKMRQALHGSLPIEITGEDTGNFYI